MICSNPLFLLRNHRLFTEQEQHPGTLFLFRTEVVHLPLSTHSPAFVLLLHPSRCWTRCFLPDRRKNRARLDPSKELPLLQEQDASHGEPTQFASSGARVAFVASRPSVSLFLRPGASFESRPILSYVKTHNTARTTPRVYSPLSVTHGSSCGNSGSGHQ